MSPWLSPVAVDLVWFSGPDAVRFLNDLISQEIGTLESGRVRRSLLLGPQGKLDHILWALRGEDLVGLVTDAGRGDELAATLGRYRIRVKADIELEGRPRWVVFESTPVEGSWSGERDSALEADVSWRTVSRTLIVGDQPSVPVGSLDDYHRARIEAGEPEWGSDVHDGTIPQEADLVDEGVDFDKGCYLGQELVARIDSRGRVTKKLRRLELSDSVEAGAEIVAGDKVVGNLTSVVGNLGLATLRFEVEPGDTVTVSGEEAIVHDL